MIASNETQSCFSGATMPVNGRCFPRAATYAEAVATCDQHGLRLCKILEVEAGNCCMTGCGLDAARIWTNSTVFKGKNGAEDSVMTLDGCPLGSAPSVAEGATAAATYTTAQVLWQLMICGSHIMCCDG